MASIDEQIAMGKLMRIANDAHYGLYLALFKFNAVACYMENIPEERFQEVETALAEVEDTLGKVRAAMSTYLNGSLSGKPQVADWR